MFHVAKIRFDDGALLLPDNDPYEREVVFEQVDFYARRHGSVDVEIGRAEMHAAAGATRPGMVCARCHETPRAVVFQVAERIFCAACVKRASRHVEVLFRSSH